MSQIPGFLLRHRVTVEPYEGQGAAGPVYGSAFTVRCLIDNKRRTVRGIDGDQVLSSAMLLCPPGTRIPNQSRVDLGDRSSIVINTAVREYPGLPTPDHVEVLCQ